jgi:pimeloyl-ACP methyl ester carboxylesterase
MKTIVLLHAFPLDHRMWDGIADDVAISGWQVFTPDLRGCGGSADWTDQEPTLRVLAEDVLSLMDNYGITNFVVAGCSLGGYVAMELIRIAPSRVAAAILIDTKASADNEEQRENRLHVASQVEEAKNTEAFCRVLLPNALGKTTWEKFPEIVEYTKSLMQDSRVNGVANLQRAMSKRSDSHQVLADFHGPILSIRGGEDVVASSEDHSRIMNAARDGIHVELSECGHLAPIEKPKETLDSVIDFLNKVSSPVC